MGLAVARRTPLALGLALPYVQTVRARRPAAVVAADVLADLVGAAALLAGSVRYGAPVL